ncbi:hypothetical protein [Bradyrhizobium sp. ERR14]|uniref:hypothetical protein n=1 Tax=Bradyrhizobium sp. ERR14 TaxID=2663837 RepID=UPI001616D9ED|nr:hypothetical protein [Bradyrhizobium sp. ERR14]MBB4396899.1 hypothetical protein [Bradyrhizobium sp. ERR14]
MPNVQWNKFIDTHKTRFCVTIYFSDYLELRKRVKGPIMTKDGKEFPTPNAVTKAMAKAIKCDYTIKSGGAEQIVMIAEKEEAAAFAKAVGAKRWMQSDGKPCLATNSARISHEVMVGLAKTARLM